MIAGLYGSSRVAALLAKTLSVSVKNSGEMLPTELEPGVSLKKVKFIILTFPRRSTAMNLHKKMVDGYMEIICVGVVESNKCHLG